VSLLRWIFRNLGTFLLAFALAVVVWISAVTTAFPSVQRVRPVPLEILGRDPNMLIVGNLPTQVRVTLVAPTDVMDSLNTSESAVTAWVDVSGLEAGTYDLEVQAQVNPAYQPVRRQLISPEIVTVVLEELITRTLPANLEVTGDLTIGYQRGIPSHEPASVTVSGPATLVERISEVRAELDISGAVETINRDLLLMAVDRNGELVSGVTISPSEVSVTQPIFLRESYRNVIVRVVTEGQPAEGYKLTNITVSPLNVVVFSSNPQLVNDLPGYVETDPVILTDAEDDVEDFAGLNLPEGVSIVGDPFVQVSVSIAAIEGSLKMTLPVEPLGLVPIRAALIQPQTVDVILLGPVPILDQLDLSDIRLIVDLTDLDLGIYQMDLQVDVLPERIEVEAVLPSTVQVEIIIAPTSTPTFVPGTPVATPQP
jgi:YbbR domain-containing protein